MLTHILVLCLHDQSTGCFELQSLLPQDPLKHPKSRVYDSQLESWVVEEAVAAYTGTGASLQAAVDLYKRNVFLAVSLTSVSPKLWQPGLFAMRSNPD